MEQTSRNRIMSDASITDVYLEPPPVDFSRALELIKDGRAMTRIPWRGQCVIFLEAGTVITTEEDAFGGAIPSRSIVERPDALQAYSIPLRMITPWSPTQRDMLAEDWIPYRI